MTVKVKVLKDIQRRTSTIKAGRVIETATDIAEAWIAGGLAELYVENRKPIDIPKVLVKEKATEKENK